MKLDENDDFGLGSHPDIGLQTIDSAINDEWWGHDWDMSSGIWYVVNYQNVAITVVPSSEGKPPLNHYQLALQVAEWILYHVWFNSYTTQVFYNISYIFIYLDHSHATPLSWTPVSLFAVRLKYLHLIFNAFPGKTVFSCPQGVPCIATCDAPGYESRPWYCTQMLP